jgi:peptide deformylase
VGCFLENAMIMIYGAPSLKMKCQEVITFNKKIKQTLDIMKERMIEGRGIGLAANQIGYTYRMFVMYDLYESQFYKIVNPVIISLDDDNIIEDEGCLSFPSIFVKISRPKSLVLSFQDENGTTQQKKFVYMNARCVLHEIEHLDGKTFLETMDHEQMEYVLDKLRKNKSFKS